MHNILYLYKDYAELTAKSKEHTLYLTAPNDERKEKLTYNVIAITQENITRFYVQKVGYADLYFLCGVQDVIPKSGIYNPFIYEQITLAERDNFWKTSIVQTESGIEDRYKEKNE